MKKLVKTRGFTPDLIGEVVSVTVLRKKHGNIEPESAQRTTGVLKAYYTNDSSGTGSFIIDGYSPRQIGDSNYNQVNVYRLEGEIHE